MCGKHPTRLQRRFNRRGAGVKNVQACLSASEDWKSSFLDCGGLVKLVQTCLCVENTLQSRLNPLGSAVKHMEACLNANNDGESSFHYRGGPVKLVQTCLCPGNTL